MATKMSEEDRTEALDALREALPSGSTVYTVLRHVSASGMQREISLHYVNDGEVRWINLRPIGLRLGAHDGWVVRGAGMDMGFHLVYTLARTLHGDGYALNHRWL